MKKLLLIAPLALLFVGCAGIGRISKNLGNDPAIVVVRMGSPWGNQQLTRVGGTTNSVTIAPDGTITINGTK